MSVLEEKYAYIETVPLKSDSVTKVENVSFLKKINNFKLNVTVEPVLFGGILASTLSRLAVQNLNLDKACRVSKQYGDEICDALIERRINSTEHEVEVQKIISAIEAWRTIIQTVIPIVLLIFMGAWSDRTGNRKVCLLLPIFGEVLVNISNVLSTIFFNVVSIEVTMVLESLLPAITGGWWLLLLGAYSYICDITSKESRTFRLGIVPICISSGIPIGMSISGLLLRLTGYYGVFSIAAVVNLVSLLYGYYKLSSNTGKSNKVSNNKRSVTFANIMTIQKETVAVVFKKRTGNNRIKIILSIFLITAVNAYDHGEDVILYLFVRYRLNWDAFKYSLYETHRVILECLGTLFSITLLSKYWGWHDSSLCILAAATKLVGSIYIVFVKTDLQMFMFPIIAALHGATYAAFRSMASKLVSVEELGKINSLISLTEILGTLIFDPFYSSLYVATMERFTAAVFVFSGVMTLPVLAVLLWFFKQHRLELKQKNILELAS